ncbi:MAG: PIN domain-containing protein [Acidobacteriota bacterium]
MTFEFVDTNILLYAHEKEASEKQRVSSKLLERLIEKGGGAVSTQVLMEFYSTGTRKLKLSSQEGEDVIESLRHWKTHSPNHASLLEAIRLQRRHKLSWFDALIVTSALALECSILWTEDLQHNQHFGSLTIKNPFR